MTTDCSLDLDWSVRYVAKFFSLFCLICSRRMHISPSAHRHRRKAFHAISDYFHVGRTKFFHNVFIWMEIPVFEFQINSYVKTIIYVSAHMHFNGARVTIRLSCNEKKWMPMKTNPFPLWNHFVNSLMKIINNVYATRKSFHTSSYFGCSTHFEKSTPYWARFWLEGWFLMRFHIICLFVLGSTYSTLSVVWVSDA